MRGGSVAKHASSATNRSEKGGAGITAEDIVLAAVRISDESGVEQLTIRRLAAELNIGAMTLYGYFRSKEEILDAVADHVLGQFKLPPTKVRSPAGVATAVGRAFLAMMHEHPCVVYLLSSRTSMSHRGLKAAMEDVIAWLRESGFDGPAATRAYALLITYCLGFASYQIPRPWGRRSDDVSELRRQRAHLYSSLPLPEFANIVELSEPITAMPSDDQFEFGLQCLVQGLLTERTAAPRWDKAGRKPI
jgi:AcrR family transcriptional regulator